ncbi:hypothetical protein [Rossellomorea vietnamensis]|uniref:hypothetical protein n=1 Tax=Rossellomorea vietnamensis TaxID=218284 RepID=UPI003D2B3CAB
MSGIDGGFWFGDAYLVHIVGDVPGTNGLDCTRSNMDCAYLVQKGQLVPGT